MTKEKYQVCTLFFSDGSKAGFTGKAVKDIESKKVTQIMFTPPTELPEGCLFEELK